ncbi:MAG: D-alanyl-D-alanine carboxypeptidase [Kofleriaceae bacterium]|nr:D-alanyl-D-alanine carboxypeptidase [Myxococcales bacterium]MCB9564785.1 D-alanyl-D-alanine carboxypeptidase [Kofleriaceae bacterium]
MPAVAAAAPAATDQADTDVAADAGLPDVRSGSAAVLDVATGVTIFAKDADEVRAIASTTKIFVAMAVRKAGIDLDGWTEITRDDAHAAHGGARTRLDVGQTFQNVDLLRAMLMASDNRAPTALARAAGLDDDGLIAAMNGIAADLGLERTTFTDTSGLRGNVSTAREMALALRAALEDPVLAEIMRTDRVRIVSKSKYAKLDYANTSQPLLAGKRAITGGKTGYTRAAGYCFVSGVEIDGRAYVTAFLGADGKLTRFADFERVAAWLDDGAPGAAVKVTTTASTGSTKAALKVRAKPTGTVKAKKRK